MPNIFIMMGNSGTRKSSTIRALTGVYNHTDCDVGTQKETTIKVYVEISSLQESDTLPEKFINKVLIGNYQNVLVSLWIHGKNGRKNYYPDGFKYIQNFIDAGWNICQIVVLGVDNLPNFPKNVTQPHYIQGSGDSPSNTNASQIREWWQWL